MECDRKRLAVALSLQAKAVHMYACYDIEDYFDEYYMLRLYSKIIWMKMNLKHLLMKRNRDIIAQYNIQLEQQHQQYLQQQQYELLNN